MTQTPTPDAPGLPKYRPEYGVYDEASLRAAFRYWEALMYADSCMEDMTSEQSKDIVRRLKVVERAMEDHDHIINEEGAYVPVAKAARPLPSDWVADGEPFGHAMYNSKGACVGFRQNTGFGYNFTVADFKRADKIMPHGAPHTGRLVYAAPSAPAEGGEDDECFCMGTGEVYTRNIGWRTCPYCKGKAQTAPEPLAQGQSDFVSPYPVAPMGHGLITIGEGHINGVRALIFGNRGSGVFGAEGEGNRRMEDGETICAITFATPESVELLRLYVNAIADSFDVPDSLEHPRPPLQFPPNHPQPSASVGMRAREIFAVACDEEGAPLWADALRNNEPQYYPSAFRVALRAIESALTTAAGGLRELVERWRDLENADGVGISESIAYGECADELEAALGRGGRGE